MIIIDYTRMSLAVTFMVHEAAAVPMSPKPKTIGAASRAASAHLCHHTAGGGYAIWSLIQKCSNYGNCPINNCKSS